MMMDTPTEITPLDRVNAALDRLAARLGCADNDTELARQLAVSRMTIWRLRNGAWDRTSRALISAFLDETVTAEAA